MKHLLANRVFVLVMVSDMLQNAGIWIRNMAVLDENIETTCSRKRRSLFLNPRWNQGKKAGTVDENFVGRLNGFMMPVFTGFLLIGTGASGIYMTATSLITVYVTSGIILIAASLISLRLTPVAKVKPQAFHNMSE